MTPDSSSIKFLIVDDEKKACTNLKNLLIEYVDPYINICGIANNTQQAEARIKELSPDAIFLDIEMPHENAFHFLERISPVNFEVIFVTAYDEYAVKAFKLNAVDYILKPISIDELRNAVSKLKDRLRFKTIMNGAATSYSDLANQVNNKIKPGKISLKDANVIEVVDFKDIYFVEANGSYSKIVFHKHDQVKEMMMSNPLSDYEEMLPADLFYRIHRSYLINCARIDNIINDDVTSVVMTNGNTLPVSRRRHALLLDFLKRHLYANE